jgi:hypothetical protein
MEARGMAPNQRSRRRGVQESRRPWSDLAGVIGQMAGQRAMLGAGTKEAAISLRFLAALGLLLFLWGCITVGKPADPSIHEIEHRHDEMMLRKG